MKSMEPTSTNSGARRRYDSSRRQADAAERRRRIIDVASNLFLSEGYGATSIEQVARESGVSVQTVYAAFESKAGLLARAVEVAVAGDHDEVAMRDRPVVQEVLGHAAPEDRLHRAAAVLAEVNSRAARLQHLVEGASAVEPALADLRRRFDEQMLDDVLHAMADVPKRALRRGLTKRAAAEMFVFLGGFRSWMALVEERGWSPARYESWLADAMCRLALVDEGP